MLGGVVIRQTEEYLVRTANVKAKYAQIVIIENAQFLSEVLEKMLDGDAEALETAVLSLKKLQDENLGTYVQITLEYIAPTLKDSSNINSSYQKVFGGKNLGATFEKIAKRVNKHICKELFSTVYQMIMLKFRLTISKMIEKAVKEQKITSVSTEQFEYFMSEEGSKIINKYSKKQ